MKIIIVTTQKERTYVKNILGVHWLEHFRKVLRGSGEISPWNYRSQSNKASEIMKEVDGTQGCNTSKSKVKCHNKSSDTI